MNLSDFTCAEEFGIAHKMPLSLPDGTKTTETLSVLGYYNPTVMTARAIYRRSMVEDTGEFNPEKDAESRRKFLAKAVVGWSFTDAAGAPVPFDSTAFEAWFAKCPHVVDDLDRFIFDRKDFLAAAV